jgi:hypothetical protein
LVINGAIKKFGLRIEKNLVGLYMMKKVEKSQVGHGIYFLKIKILIIHQKVNG